MFATCHTVRYSRRCTACAQHRVPSDVAAGVAGELTEAGHQLMVTEFQAILLSYNVIQRALMTCSVERRFKLIYQCCSRL